jgi:hypothetical protein
MIQIEREEQQVVEWIKDGFTQYALRFTVATPTVYAIPNSTEVKAYGEEFARIILEGIEVELRQDLYQLIEWGCPAVALVELMLVCTRGFRFTLTDVRHLEGITEKLLRELHILPRVTKVIDTLVNAHSGPLFALEEIVPSKKEQNRVRRCVKAIPESLRILARLLKEYPRKGDPMTESIADNRFLLALYLLLHHYGGHGFPTLSRVLTMMRRVKQNVSLDAKYLRDFSATPITSGQKQRGTGERALQRRLHRFCEEYRHVLWNAHLEIQGYTGRAYAEKREQGKTLIDMVAEDRKPVDEADPQNWVDLDTKQFKLDDNQRAGVLAIYLEQEEQIAKIISAAMPRCGATSPFSSVFSAEVSSKMERLEMSAREKIRSVLDAEQRKKFDRRERTGDRIIERMKHKTPDLLKI